MIDLIFLVLVILAVVKGLRKGFVLAAFAIIAYIVGLAAALKLSAVVAGHLQKNISVSTKWLPFISFALVFLLVVILINIAGKLLQKSVEMVFMGWANRIAGVALYLIAYTIIFSFFLFYAEKIKVIGQPAIQQSLSYSYIRPWGPVIIDGLGKVIPLFKDLFTQLEFFFESIAHKIQH